MRNSPILSVVTTHHNNITVTTSQYKMGVGGQETSGSADKKCQIIPGGFAGTGPNGSFFETPAWVDKDKAPGMTSQAPVVAPAGWYVVIWRRDNRIKGS